MFGMGLFVWCSISGPNKWICLFAVSWTCKTEVQITVALINLPTLYFPQVTLHWLLSSISTGVSIFLQVNPWYWLQSCFFQHFYVNITFKEIITFAFSGLSSFKVDVAPNNTDYSPPLIPASALLAMAEQAAVKWVCRVAAKWPPSICRAFAEHLPLARPMLRERLLGLVVYGDILSSIENPFYLP